MEESTTECPSCLKLGATCPYCVDFAEELKRNGGERVSFRRALEIAAKHGLVTESMRAEWLRDEQAAEASR